MLILNSHRSHLPTLSYYLHLGYFPLVASIPNHTDYVGIGRGQYCPNWWLPNGLFILCCYIPLRCCIAKIEKIYSFVACPQHFGSSFASFATRLMPLKFSSEKYLFALPSANPSYNFLRYQFGCLNLFWLRVFLNQRNPSTKQHSYMKILTSPKLWLDYNNLMWRQMVFDNLSDRKFLSIHECTFLRFVISSIVDRDEQSKCL